VEAFFHAFFTHPFRRTHVPLSYNKDHSFVKTGMQQELTTATTDGGFMGAASALAHRLRLPTTLIKFAMVGGIAFGIYQVFLYLIYGEPPVSFLPDLTGIFWFLPDRASDPSLFSPDIRLVIALLISLEAAVLFQFSCHERWTFRHRPRNGWIGRRLIKFNVNSIVSPIIIFLTTIVLHSMNVSPYVSSFVGVLIGFAWNWTLNSLVIWPNERLEPVALPLEDETARAA
jgi:putative flippase GtrA